MPRVRKHFTEKQSAPSDKKLARRVCTTIESLLRDKLNVPRHAILAEPFPFPVNRVQFLLEYIRDNISSTSSSSSSGPSAASAEAEPSPVTPESDQDESPFTG